MSREPIKDTTFVGINNFFLTKKEKLVTKKLKDVLLKNIILISKLINVLEALQIFSKLLTLP